MSEGDLYAGREQTLVKHFILERYLERFAYIVGSAWNTLTYVDCFSGPWNVRSDRLQDSSFYIALNQLRKATTDLAKRGRTVALRCLFLEKNATAYDQLRRFAEDVKYAEVETRNSALETAIGEICDFVKRGGESSFPFFFVDPTGWSGFAMDLIGPLLRFTPGEVLVNFMTGHILRFAEHSDPAVQQSFDRLFGSIDYRARIDGLKGRDREDALVQCYCDAIGSAGSYDYVCPAIVLHPENDRTHFHLLYATRNAKGVDVFKQVEKKAMEVMEKARGEAQKRKRVHRSGQLELLDAQQMHDTGHYDGLRERHLAAARSGVEQLLQTQRAVLYDQAWSTALSHPLVWESDLKTWIAEWVKAGKLAITGMNPRERVPKLGAGQGLVWSPQPPC